MLPNLFQQDWAPPHRSCHTVAYLCSNVPEFIERETGRQTARILIRLIMQFGGALQQMVYRRKISDIDHLKQLD